MAVVLIVEDDEQVSVMSESILRDAGHTVIAATGAEGTAALLAIKQPIDILFVDLKLGNDQEAGLRLAHEAKTTRPELSFLYTTGAGLNEGMKAMFQEPCLFLPKPYTLEQLTESIAFLLSKAKPPSTMKWPVPQSENTGATQDGVPS